MLIHVQASSDMTEMTSYLKPVTSLFLSLAPSSKAKENNVHLLKYSKMKKV